MLLKKQKIVDELNKFIVKQVGPYLDATETFLINLRNTVLKPATAVIQTKLLPLAFQLNVVFWNS